MKTRLPVCALTVLLAASWGMVVSGWVYSGHKWPVTEIPYYVNPSNQDVSNAAALAAFRWAADQWSAQTNANVRFVYMGLTNVTAGTKNGINEFAFNHSASSVIGRTARWWNGAGTLIETDLILYDASWNLFAGYSGCSSGYYIEEIAIHELGHALGLNHSDVSGATMKAGASKCATWKGSLHSDDITAVETIYGLLEPPPDPDPTPEPDPDDPPPTGLQAQVLSYVWDAAKGRYVVTIGWSGFTSASVDIYQDGVLRGSSGNDGQATIGTSNPGPSTFLICEVGTSTCAAPVSGGA